MKKKYYIYHHLGLGDHIIVNGLIRKLIKDDGLYFLFCKKHNLDSVEFMFKDLTNLKIISVNNDLDVIKFINGNNITNVIKIGHENLEFIKRFYNCTWDESFYKQLNVDFEERWDSFYYERDEEVEDSLFNECNPEKVPYALIHNLDSTGTDRIDYNKVSPTLKRIYVTKSDTIFDYGKLIENANEVHCIDSSFKHIVDSIPTNGVLFYHKNYNFRSTSSDDHKYRKNWNVI
jgi:hypothetical protein